MNKMKKVLPIIICLFITIICGEVSTFSTSTAEAASKNFTIKGNGMIRFSVTTGKGAFWKETVVTISNTGGKRLSIFPEFGSWGGKSYDRTLSKNQSASYKCKGSKKTYYCTVQVAGGDGKATFEVATSDGEIR